MPEVELCPGRWVGDNHPVFVIAELGQNHQGDVCEAKKMIAAAAEAGADCVKFQKSCLKEKFNSAALERSYNGPNSWGSTYGEHKQHLELSEDNYRELQSYAESLGIEFTASAMDIASVDFLHSINVPFIKVGSGDVNHLALHDKAARTERPLVVSTGMSNMSWVRTVHENLTKTTNKLVLMQCTSAYPTDPTDVNLRVLDTYRSEFPQTVLGYSGHELGVAITLAAIDLGASVIERHFTLDRHQKGSDHQCSLEPADLASLVKLAKQRPGMGTLRELYPDEGKALDLALGSGEKVMSKSEMACKRKLGKTIVAKRKIAKGEVISSDDVVVKVAEPPGIDPSCVDLYLGKVAAREIEQDQSINSWQLTQLQFHLVQVTDGM